MKGYLILLATILVLAISYYFVVALPANERARLEFEQQKYAAEQKEKAMQEQAATLERTIKEQSLQNCLSRAQQQANGNLRANSEPADGKPGLYRAPGDVMDRLQREYTAAQELCRQLYVP